MIFVAKVTLVPDTCVCRKGSSMGKMEMESATQVRRACLASPSQEVPVWPSQLHMGDAALKRHNVGGVAGTPPRSATRRRSCRALE